MPCNARTENYVDDDQGNVYALLGANDTRTATHILIGRMAIPVCPPKGQLEK